MALIATALAANASAPVLAFSESEIWLAPGESMEVHIVLQSIDETVSAGQIGFNVYDPTRIRDNGVVLDDCYGDKHYFLPEYSSENSYANSGCTETGVYRIMFYDFMGTYGTGYWPLESFTGPVNVFAFTVHATEGWNDQYVTIELDKDWSYVISPSNDHNYFTEPMVLTVKNKAADWPVTATPDITTEMTDDAVIVTATGDGEVKLYQDGIEVENPCVVPRTYVNQTILFGATAWDEGKLMSDMIRKNVAIPAHSYYIVGNAPFGDWDPTAGVMMTPNGDGTYSYVADIDGSVWFVFASGLAADWETFNANYRYGPSDYDLVVGLDQWVATPRGGNMAYKFTGNAAVYTITFDPANLCFRIVFNDWSMRTDTPVITAETTEEAVIVTATGNGEVKLYKGGVEVENPYYVPRTDVDQTITFRATAREEGKLISETVTLVVTVPAMDLPTSDAPVITAETTADAVIVTAIGNGEVKLYRNGVEVDNPCVIPRTDVDCTFTFTATCKEEGKLISDVVTMTVLVPAMEQPSGDGISVYVKADQAPYLYSWTDNGDQPCGGWPGMMLTDVTTINRVDYYVYTFDAKYSSINLILNNGAGGYGSQTGDFVGITQDAYFVYDGGGFAYGVIPPTVYGNPTGEYAFYVNTDHWSRVYAEVDGVSYPMTKVGVDGAGYEVYKWEAEMAVTPSRITFSDGYGNGVTDAYGNVYDEPYVRGGYYVYTFFANKSYADLDRVATIAYAGEDQVPVLEGCAIRLLSDEDTWNGYADVEFEITGTYFNQSARKGNVYYSVDGSQYMMLTGELGSEDTFAEVVTLSFDPSANDHTITLISRDESGAASTVVTVLKAVDIKRLTCANLQDYDYTGEAITFDPEVYDYDNLLTAGEDYEASFLNNVEPGTATLRIQGKPLGYMGSTDLNFTINPHAISGDVHLDGVVDWYYYTGSPITPAVVVIDDTFGTLTKGQDYEVTYENNDQVGWGIAVVDGIGHFTGHFELPFKIIGIPGDVNYSGYVDITDLQAMVNYIFGEYNRPFNFTAADLNNDHVVNVQDVVGEANLLLSMDLLAQAPGASLRAPRQPGECAASLWWKDDVLYLRTSVPVAAIDIMNQVDGDIQWTVGQYGLVVKSTTDGGYHHAVIYSLGDGLIEPGVLPIATTTGRSAMVAAAMLSDDNAELVDVELNNQITGINRVETDDDVTCHMDGSVLAITSGTMLNDVDVTIYSIDGKIISNKKLGRLESGTTVIDMSGIVGSNRYLIVVVRNGRQILSTQKLTQNK